MKELSEQLKEMLKNWLQAPDAEIMTDDIAITVISDEITALVNDNYVPKEFVEWMLKNAAYSDVPAKEFTSKWNVITEDNTWVYFTTDEAIEYWKTEIRDK